MKKSLLTITLLVAAIVCFTTFVPSTGAALAEDGNYEITSPALDNYLFLDNPSLVAVSGNSVAVYDKGLNKVMVAGDVVAEYDLAFLGAEKVVSIAFANDNVFVFSDRARLYNLTANSGVNMQYDATSMTGDGAKLYFYNGMRTVYTYDGVSFAAYTDSASLIFYSTAFTVSGDNAYFAKENVIYKLPLTASSSATALIEHSADSLLPAADGIVAINADGVTAISAEGIGSDTNTLATAFPDASDVSFVAADGNSIAVLSFADKAVYRYGYDLTLSDTYGCSGKKVGWFNNPQKVVRIDSGYAIWDKGNRRVELLQNGVASYVNYANDYDTFTATAKRGIFCDGKNLTFFPLTETVFTPTSAATTYDIGAICATENKVFVYDKISGTIYYADFTVENPTFKPFCVSYNAITDMCATGGDNPVIYAHTGTSISVFSVLGKSNASIQLNGEISGFDVDAVGNIYTIKNDDGASFVTKYTRTLAGFTAETPVPLIGNFAIEGATSLALNLDGQDDVALTLDSTKNLLIELSLDFVRTEEYVAPDEIQPTLYNGEISFAKSKGTVIYKYNDNCNLVSGVAATGDIVAVLDGHCSEDVLFVLTANGDYGYVAKSDTIAATPLTASGTVIALFDSVNLYKLPSTDTAATSFDKSQVFTLVNDCADFGDGIAWYKVSYQAGGNTYYGYLMKTRVMSHTVVPVIEEPVYAKAKAVRLGATVNIYAMADEASAVLKSVTDGTKLKLLADYDSNSKFTYVEYDGATGYVLTAELQLTKGLTGGQIAAIVLASVTLLITCVYLIISHRNKKLSSK